MLCLKRKRGERLMFELEDGTTCQIVVNETSRNWVRLALDFPKSVVIHREEVQNEIDGVDPHPKPSLAAILKHRKD